MFYFKIDNFFWFFLLILIPILFIFRSLFSVKQLNCIEIPSYNYFNSDRFFKLLSNYYFYNKIIIIILLIISISRPQLMYISDQVIDQLGVDIMMVIDVSNSMLSRDIIPNRLSVLKKNAKNFIQNRIFDRIGIVIFSGEAITKIPLTLDKKLLISTIDEINSEFLDDGTAIGTGICTAINHFKYSKSRSKVILLITDGDNNLGLVNPYLSANIAKSYGIKIYTIGIGSKGTAETPVAMNSITGEFIYQMVPVTINEDLLINIANITNGKYFRAKNNTDLNNIYKTIDRLEKYNINIKNLGEFKELYKYFIQIALLLLFIELMCKLYFFKFIN